MEVSAAPPANDDFENRILLTGDPVSGTSNNEEAALQSEPYAGAKSVWWSWTAPETRVYTIEGESLDRSFSPSLGIYTGSTLSKCH